MSGCKRCGVRESHDHNCCSMFRLIRIEAQREAAKWLLSKEFEETAYARGKADGMAEARKLDYTEESMRIGGDIELAKVVAWLRKEYEWSLHAGKWAADALERGEHKK